jgi:hypothetical protein
MGFHHEEDDTRFDVVRKTDRFEAHLSVLHWPYSGVSGHPFVQALG